MTKQQLRQKKDNILLAFCPADIENPITLVSLADAFEALDMEYASEWQERVELATITNK